MNISYIEKQCNDTIPKQDHMNFLSEAIRSHRVNQAVRNKLEIFRLGFLRIFTNLALVITC
jgi:hypothetical protein